MSNKIMTDSADKKWKWPMIAFFGAILGISAVEFLSGQGGTSGWSILAQQKWYEWLWMIVGTVGAVAVVLGFLRYYNKTQDVKGIKVFAIAIGVFLGIAFGKACTDKTNGGVTSASGRVGGPAKVDSTREAAEDIIKDQQKK